MPKSTHTPSTTRDKLASLDWPYFAGATAAAGIVAQASIVFPLWSDAILGAAASTALILLGIERARERRRMERLAAQIDAIASIEKIEVPHERRSAVLDKALNAAIQRTREQARMAQLSRHALPTAQALRLREDDDGAARSVAVLALGLPEQDQASVSAETMERLRDIAGTVVEVAERRSALLQMQGSTTFALIFAAFSQDPAARSADEAYDAAAELMAAHPGLHFGLSSGTGVSCTLPGAGYTVIGAPLEEAIRLHRLAATWNEYRLLCPEPVALLLRPRAAGQRTPLELTSASAPSLPVYALEVTPADIALGA